jgi:hypothetical protein
MPFRREAAAESDDGGPADKVASDSRNKVVTGIVSSRKRLQAQTVLVRMIRGSRRRFKFFPDRPPDPEFTLLLRLAGGTEEGGYRDGKVGARARGFQQVPAGFLRPRRKSRSWEKQKSPQSECLDRWVWCSNTIPLIDQFQKAQVRRRLTFHHELVELVDLA